MEEKETSLAWELIQDRNRLTNKLINSIVAIVITMCITFAVIAGAFVWYLNQYDFTSTTETITENTVEADSSDGGDAHAIINNSGEVNVDGEGEGDNKN